MKLLLAEPVITYLNQHFAKELQNIFFQTKKTYSLAIISVGDDFASSIFIKNKIKFFAKYRVKVFYYKYSKINAHALDTLISDLNKNSLVQGILLQLPLPNELNASYFCNKIAPTKDIDCLNNFNLGKLTQLNSQTNKDAVLLPAVVFAIYHLCKYYKIELSKTHVAVINNSFLIGKPLLNFFASLNATVTIFNKNSSNISTFCKNNIDLLISATGVVNLIDENYISQKMHIIDVGINYDLNNKICGDVDFKSVNKKCAGVTPVPGGVGPLTIYGLLINLLNIIKNN